MKVAGIRFRKAGKIYYFDPGSVDIHPGEHVIVETVRGIEYGTVVLADKEVEDDQVVQPLKKVLRLATEEDREVELRNKEREREAFTVCKSKIIKHDLDMKLIDCEYTFDNNKLLFYFTADGRVDFRELVKDLASVFKTRIELRQIGVRDETKMLGSIGICGRTLCCHAHLSDFHPVSIKMAKDQNLSLNPTKISGVCGRLMCCLKYEEDTYKELNKNLPRSGSKVRLRYSGEIAEVINTNILRQLVKVVIRKEDGAPEILEMKLEDLEIQQRDGKFQKRPPIQKPKEKKGSDGSKDASVKSDGERSGDKEEKQRQKTQRSNRGRSRGKQGGNKGDGSNRQKSSDDNRSKNTKQNMKASQSGSQKPKGKQSDSQIGERKTDDNKSSTTSRNRRPRNRSNKKKQDSAQNQNKE